LFVLILLQPIKMETIPFGKWQEFFEKETQGSLKVKFDRLIKTVQCIVASMINSHGKSHDLPFLILLEQVMNSLARFYIRESTILTRILPVAIDQMVGEYIWDGKLVLALVKGVKQTHCTIMSDVLFELKTKSVYIYCKDGNLIYSDHMPCELAHTQVKTIEINGYSKMATGSSDLILKGVCIEAAYKRLSNSGLSFLQDQMLENPHCYCSCACDDLCFHDWPYFIGGMRSSQEEKKMWLDKYYPEYALYYQCKSTSLQQRIEKAIVRRERARQLLNLANEGVSLLRDHV
jgi:hypothetical protein